MIRTRTKIEAVLAVAFLLAISISSVFAVTRTISDTSDTVDTYIRNSNGKYWAATGANLQLAIYDLNSTWGGTVQMPSGNITLTTDLKMCSRVTLKGMGRDSTILKLGAASTTTHGIYCLNINNFTLCDFSFNGNDGSITDNYQAIYIYGCKYFNVHSIHIYNMYRSTFEITGAVAYTGSVNGHVYDIDVDNVKQISKTFVYQGFDITNSAYIIVENFHVKGKGTLATTQDCWGMDFVGIKWCQLNDILIEGTGLGVKFAGTSDANQNHNITVNNLQIRGLTNITSDCALWCQYMQNSTFNNVLISSAHSGIIISSGGRFLTFNNINVYGGADTGINSNGKFLIFNNVNVENNGNIGMYFISSNDNILNNVRVVGSTSDGMDFDTCARFVISNCEIKSNGVVGIYGSTISSFIIKGTQFYSNGNDAIDIVDGTTPNNFTISDCLFNSNAKAIDVAATANYFVIGGCICQVGDGIDINAVRSGTRRVNDTICVLTES